MFSALRRIASVLLPLWLGAAQAQTVVPEMTRENLLVVVRESIGANRQEDRLQPMGKFKVRLGDGREVEGEMASWSFIGDTHIRFVFDGPQSMRNATPQDLERLGIQSVDEALALALSNIHRVYGEPAVSLWQSGVYEVQGKSPDLDSSYFLDRNFWQGLLAKYSDGLAVAVPKRGGLLFAPMADAKAVEGLKRGVSFLHDSSGHLRVSGAVFLFKDGRWSVLQAAQAQK